MQTIEFSDIDSLIDFIRKEIEKSGKTQLQIAERIGIKQPAVNHALNIKKSRYNKTRLDILQSFGYTVENIVRIK